MYQLIHVFHTLLVPERFNGSQQVEDVFPQHLLETFPVAQMSEGRPEIVMQKTAEFSQLALPELQCFRWRVVFGWESIVSVVHLCKSCLNMPKSTNKYLAPSLNVFAFFGFPV